MKPMSHPADFAPVAIARMDVSKPRLQRVWVKVNGKLESRYEMDDARK